MAEPFRIAANTAQLTVQVQGQEDAFEVLEYSAQESISQPFRYSLDLVSTQGDISAEDVLTKQCHIEIFGGDGSPARFANGAITAFERVGQSERYSLYKAQVVPRMQLLAHRFDCRIYTDQAAPDIIEDVLSQAGLTGTDYELQLEETYVQREYCVQYRESDLNFISRLMEDEGMFYFFDHSDEGHKLIVADKSTAHKAIPAGEASETLPFNPNVGLAANEEFVFRLTDNEMVTTNHVTVRDFDFLKPTLDHMQLEETGDSVMALESYDYPGLYIDPSIGQHRATMRFQAIQAAKRTISGTTTCRRLVPGHFFELQGHTDEALNRRFLLTSVQVNATQPAAGEAQGAGGGNTSYQVQFTAIPFEVPFRAPRRARRPVVEGIQTAIVVPNSDGSNEEIFTDEHGRIKVKFHWDRRAENDEHSSCWMRVSTPWAGAGWGAISIPRVGHEVVVDFLEGDPDRPLVVGSVYHGNNKPPYPLPAEKTKSTLKSNSSLGGGGFNEMRFEDKKGEEEIYVHAQKNLNQKVLNNKSVFVGNDESLSVGNNRTKTVAKDEKNKIDHDRTTEISNDDTLTVTGGNLTTAVQAGNRDVKVVAGTDTLYAEKKITIESATEIQLVTGAASITMKKNGDIEISGKDITVKGSSDIKTIASKQVAISGKEFNASGSKEAIMGVGTQTVTLNQQKAQISGTAITSSAIGSHEITGAIIKIN